MYSSPNHDEDYNPDHDRPDDSNRAGRSCGSNSDDGEDEVGVPILDYSPLERLRCGSRVYTQTTVNPTGNFAHVPRALAAPKADWREVGGIGGLQASTLEEEGLPCSQLQ
jgi:hypothetical protein